MGQNTIDTLIINAPYDKPNKHWRYDHNTRLFDLVEGRRPAGYVIASGSSKSFDDPGIFVEIPLVNQIRPRVDAWREAGYPGVTGITRRLLEHWNDPNQRYLRFFFCQMEAIETLIWLTEAPEADKTGVEIPSDGGLFKRLCSKMATGSGKTIIMAMLIAWQVLNKVAYPQDPRFSKYFLVVAPGLTVKSRLQVLIPTEPGNYYDQFKIVLSGLWEKLLQAKVKVINWHVLNWETEEWIAKRKSVDKRGAKSDEAYVREVLGEMARVRNIVVINDEAHHAWRVPAESKVKGVKKADIEEATKWVGGLDRIHRSRNIVACYDFSATPFAPTGKTSSEEALFSWIASDFGLNDAIESGLVKTPRMVIRDDAVPDAKTYKSKFYHIYNWVKDDLNRKAEEHEPLPDLVNNAYYLLGTDWLATAKHWRDEDVKVPPVMITVANRTETAARVKYGFDHNQILIEELCDPEKTLHIDSKALEKAESRDDLLLVDNAKKTEGENSNRKLSKDDLAQQLRAMVDTVGKRGKPGEQIQNVISVGMLSEGWDAKTVTHIMGLRAFSSQLLCEQVVGRGLRRTSYEINQETGKYDPEYVNIFGVPFTFLPHESKEGHAPPPSPPKTQIEPVPEKKEYEISWPNIIRIDHQYRPELSLEWDNVKSLILNASDTATRAELAKTIEGKPDLSDLSEVDLQNIAQKFRMQKIIFETSRNIFDQMKPNWDGDKYQLLAQIVHLVEQFITSGKIKINPPNCQDELRRRILITLNMSKVVQHIWEAIRFENTKSLTIVFDKDKPIRSTGQMRTWYTGKPCERAKKSHINFCVLDSTWEATEAFELDHNQNVKTWVKNDHLGFDINYIFRGEVHKYWPDFIIRLNTGEYLVLETKGRDTQKDRTKREFLDEWIRAVNENGGFGHWQWDVSRDPADVAGIINKAVSNKQVVDA